MGFTLNVIYRYPLNYMQASMCAILLCELNVQVIHERHKLELASN